jgi:hypothetical protein
MNTLHPLNFRYLGSVLFGVLMSLSTFNLRADEPLPYAAYFNPDKGFKPAQRNFQQIFLQLAGSLEHSGSPEAYLKHVMAEHARIDAKYKKASGKATTSRPAYFTDEYLAKLIKNWNEMAPTLALESLCRQSGRNMRYAIMGAWNMSLDEMVTLETKLTKEDAATYRAILEKDYFAKADFPMLDKFYQGPYDKLTEHAKSQLSVRTWRGTQTPEKRAESIRTGKGGTILLRLLNDHQDKSHAYFEEGTPVTNADTLLKEIIATLQLEQDEVALEGLDAFERDALKYSHLISAAFKMRIDHVKAEATVPSAAKDVEEALNLMAKTLLVAAQMEFTDASYSALADQSPPKR